MQLTSLEIKGFKSFGDRIEINFNEGITGIVGPNGCGKSNVIDAIRWVLGEQKTSALRSEKMENILFNGSKQRKPTNMAEVSLTFKNTKNLLPTEYNTVTISRRYYRSGDSEYLLNGVTCRLKDIHGLFLDTGITANSYAIIELRMVEELLNDKENARRGLFEEAAGISKFKVRRKETMRKLRDTDADLERVDDLLAEIEKNMRSLERQAKTAQRYFKLKEDYRKWSLSLACLEIVDLRDQFLRATQELQTASDQRTALSSQMALKTATIEEQKAILTDTEHALKNQQTALNQQVNKIRDYQSAQHVALEKKRLLIERAEQLQQQCEELMEQQAMNEQQTQATNMSLQSSERQFNDSEMQRSQLEQQKNQLKAQVDEYKQKMTSAISAEKASQQRLYQAQKALEVAKVQQSALKQELEKNAAQEQQQKSELSTFEQALLQLDQEHETQHKAITALEAEERQLKESIAEQQQVAEGLREQVRNANRILDAKTNELQLKQSIMENLEGYPEALQCLRQQSAWSEGPAPLLSEIVDAPKQYHPALYAFLEPFMHYFVVQTQAEAMAAIQLLKSAEKGKANFFILDNISGAPVGTPLPACTLAAEVAVCDSTYKPLLELLLHGVYFVAHRQQIPLDTPGIFITNEGDFIQKKFSIGGGAINAEQNSHLGSGRQIEQLTKLIAQLREQLKTNEDALETTEQEIHALQSASKAEQLSDSKIALGILAQERAVAKSRFEQTQQLISQGDNNRQEVEEKLGMLAEEIALRTPQLEEEQQKILELQEEAEIFEEDHERIYEDYQRVESQFNTVNLEFHKLEHRMENTLQQLEQLEQLSVKLKKSVQQQKQELEKNRREQEAVNAYDTGDDEVLDALNAERTQMEEELTRMEKNYGQARSQVELEEGELKQYQREKEVADELMLKYSHLLNETKMAMSATKERLSVEFEVDLEQLLEEDQSETEEEEQITDLELLKQKVAETKDKLAKVGPINPLAVEAFDEIKTRYQFITEQKEDLEAAKTSLMETIGHIDQTAKENFMHAFDQIKTNFIRVFRSLFTEEDDCDLKLSDPENPLESKIDIIAKPKGKRPLSISQLSGGEKTLTATSLLFAIYLLKPAPFCIFDEVDAPLDDANIDKFNNIIRTFSNESQFIIVTHNKRTMASTDIMYGVTMLEQGVSRVVPVDLRPLTEQVPA